MTPNKLGLLIRSMREERRWSVRRLAREAGVSAGYVSQLENGVRPLTPMVTGCIADAFGVPPYTLLSQFGFIPPEHLAEAEDMARKGLEVPNIAKMAVAREGETEFDWLVIDYLYMLGDDPYGTGWDAGEGGNHADWTPLVPDAPEPLPNRIRDELEAIRRAKGIHKEPQPIEGWEDLSEADRELVQQMVNRFRGSTTGE